MEINFTSDVLKKWGAIALIVLVLAGGVYYLGISGVFDRLFSNDLQKAKLRQVVLPQPKGSKLFSIWTTRSPFLFGWSVFVPSARKAVVR